VSDKFRVGQLPTYPSKACSILGPRPPEANSRCQWQGCCLSGCRGTAEARPGKTAQHLQPCERQILGIRPTTPSALLPPCFHPRSVPLRSALPPLAGAVLARAAPFHCVHRPRLRNPRSRRCVAPAHSAPRRSSLRYTPEKSTGKYLSRTQAPKYLSSNSINI